MSADRVVRSLVVLSGPPASGKTTIRRLLAQELRIPFLSRDDFKPVVVTAGVPAVADGVFNHPQHVDAFRAFVAARSLDCFELRLVADVATLLER